MEFFVTAQKRYSSHLQDQLDKLIRQEHLNPRPYKQEVPVLLYSAHSGEGVWELLGAKYGTVYSHFYLLNNHALQLLRDHGVSVNTLGAEAFDDPLDSGFALLIRSSRFL